MLHIPVMLPCVAAVTAAENYGRFALSPLEAGYGLTLGNALRRVLLSSIPGTAITKLKLDGVAHEFTSIPGVREDVTELVLNLKGVRLRSYAERAVSLTLARRGGGVVRAGDIDTPSTVEIANPHHHLCTIDDPDGTLVMDLTVERGRGTFLADHRDAPLPVGEIAIDAIFNPVIKVNYVVEPADSGPALLERLLIEIWTDGTLKAGDALSHAAQLLVQYSRAIAQFAQPDLHRAEPNAPAPRLPDAVYEHSIEQLELTTRTYNLLKRAGITQVGQLLAMDDKAMGNVRNMGEKAIAEIKERLQTYEAVGTAASTPGAMVDR